MNIKTFVLSVTFLFMATCEAFASGAQYTLTKKTTLQDSYTLEQCLETALKNNPLLKAAGWRYKAAKEREKHAKGERWPSIKATGGYKYLVNPLAIIPSRFNGDTQRVFSDEFLADTVFGLIPLALNLGEGGDMLKPMAVAVIGGLLYSLLLTLIFLPSAYTLIKRNKPPESLNAN